MLQLPVRWRIGQVTTQVNFTNSTLSRSASLYLVTVGLAIIAAESVLAQPGPIPVRVAVIEEQRLAEEISFVATLEPNVTTTVGAMVAGRINKIGVREGDRVIAGKTQLVELDRRAREIALRENEAVVERTRQKWNELKTGYRREEVAQRKAEFDEQKAIAERAEKDWQRADQLFRDQFISRSELDRVKSEWAAAKEKQNRLQAALELAERGPRQEEIAQAEAEFREAEAQRDLIAYELSRTKVVAPFTGYVVKKHADVGGWVNPGDRLMDVVDLDPIFATGPVGERRVDILKEGLTAKVGLDAIPGRVFDGRIAHIVPQADVRSRTFPVKVSIANADGRLKSGMLARVTVQVPAERASLVVPKDAVLQQGGAQIVFTVEGDTAHSHKVRTGRTVAGAVEIFHDSLRAGQQVAILGNELLKDRTKVRVDSGRKVTPKTKSP